MGIFRDIAEDGQKALDAAVTIVEHPERIVESAVEFGADLNRHSDPY